MKSEYYEHDVAMQDHNQKDLDKKFRNHGYLQNKKKDLNKKYQPMFRNHQLMPTVENNGKKKAMVVKLTCEYLLEKKKRTATPAHHQTNVLL